MPANFTISPSLQDDLRYIWQDINNSYDEEGNTIPREWTPWQDLGYQVVARQASDGEAYEDAMRQAFQFLRRNDDGRYSSRAKMRVLNAAEAAERARVAGHEILNGEFP